MYIAEGHQVFYCYPDETGTHELFLTVHQIKDTDGKTIEVQAIFLADMLNNLPCSKS